MQDEETDFEAWLATRPESVQKLAREFPPGTTFKDPSGVILHVIGWSEEGHVIASKINPFVDYKGALSERLMCHVDCLRAAIAKH